KWPFFLADCTHSWENIEVDDLAGAELSLAVDSDRSIGFIADQVTKELNDWSNFIKPSQDQLEVYVGHLAWLNTTPDGRNIKTR
ncbi:MAG: hypothetical protein IPI17_01920, partial [Nitrosomonas sp.]|nr:hypothetical protein [Nitrosomonas sp.]